VLKKLKNYILVGLGIVFEVTTILTLGIHCDTIIVKDAGVF